jgi:hypothetical protein
MAMDQDQRAADARIVHRVEHLPEAGVLPGAGAHRLDEQDLGQADHRRRGTG